MSSKPSPLASRSLGLAVNSRNCPTLYSTYSIHQQHTIMAHATERVLDPDGDVWLVLKNPKRVPFQFYDGPEISASRLRSMASQRQQRLQMRREDANGGMPEKELPAREVPQDVPLDEQVPPDVAPGEENRHTGDPVPTALDGETPDEARFLVSSRHLLLASPVFRAMSRGIWLEEVSDGEGSPETWTTTDWDPEAFLTVLSIIHSRYRFVPQSVSSELLARIATVVDYYGCHEAMENFAELWFLKRTDPLPLSYGKECILWMFSSWVFSQKEVFETMVRLAIMDAKGPIQNMGLPFPPSLLGSFLAFDYF
ncbi:hypothetical protein GMORB2_3029 [Geosmithia morbida]|uniref:BTB domain-containing protein n=1 Tax=Geosmithia morbida TaxID=1094350 RepID=A0A9P4YP80_9HYPO|nr:uncharacterized protein GMORB2_3029 [Geosmithia morbida]KAF4120591.1 hypothetical protein GMORB2_3029 [Geosmithia morbida]